MLAGLGNGVWMHVWMGFFQTQQDLPLGGLVIVMVLNQHKVTSLHGTSAKHLHDIRKLCFHGSFVDGPVCRDICRKVAPRFKPRAFCMGHLL